MRRPAPVRDSVRQSAAIVFHREEDAAALSGEADRDRLHCRVQTQLQQDPLSIHLFVFTNARRNRVKISCWDGSGLWVCAKRLEQGRFTWPVAQSALATLRGEELLLLLAGLEVREKRGWYRR